MCQLPYPPPPGGRAHRLRGPSAALTVLVAVLLLAPALQAQPASTTISTSGTPLLQVITATPGLAPTAVTSASTYSVTTGSGTPAQRITVQLSSAMPSGVTLQLTLAAPSGAFSRGTVTLSTTPTEAVYNIVPQTTGNNLALTYRLAATSAAGRVALSARTVTFTVVN